MKKKLFLVIIALIFFLPNNINAQESTALNSSTPTPFTLTFSKQILIKGVEREISLSWTKYLGATKYNLLFKESGSDWQKASLSKDFTTVLWQFESDKDLELQTEACLQNGNCFKSNIVSVPFDHSLINSPNISFIIYPHEPITLGEQHIIKIQVKDADTKPCLSCRVKFLISKSQPGDEITPINSITDSSGNTEVRIRSFIPLNRLFLVDVFLPDGTKLGTKSIELHYQNTPMAMAYVKLVSYLVFDKHIALPPLGNVFIKVLNETDLGNGQREVELVWNSPFGTKFYNIHVCSENKDCRIILTTNTQAKIIVNKSSGYILTVDACTKGTSCVNSNAVNLGIVDTPESISYDINKSNTNYNNSKEFQQQSSDSANTALTGPLGAFLKTIYSLF